MATTLVLGEALDPSGCFELFRDGFQCGVGCVDVVDEVGYEDDIARGEVLKVGDTVSATLTNAEASCDVHILTDCMRLPDPCVTTDEISQLHNQQRVVLPNVVCVLVNDHTTLLASRDARWVLPVDTATVGLIPEWSMLRSVTCIVHVTVGARITLEVLSFVVLKDVCNLRNVGWPRESGAFPFHYTSSCGEKTALSLVVPTKMTGVIWHCPSSHRNQFVGDGSCAQCGHSPLLATYEVHLQRAGRYGRYTLSEAVACKVLGSDHGLYQGLGTGPDTRLRAVLAAAAARWCRLLIRRDHPCLVGAFPMENRVIVGFQ
jgi:hypothetical protein